jgi:hypothetical protein
MKDIDAIETIDLSKLESIEHRYWVRIIEGVSNMNSTLRQQPNMKGLKQARSTGFNVLTDVQMLLDYIEKQYKYAM